MHENELICVEEVGMGLRKRGLALKMLLILSILALITVLASCSCGEKQKDPAIQDTATPTATQAVGGVTVVPNTAVTMEPTPTTVAEDGGGTTVPATATSPASGDATVDAGGGSGQAEATAPPATATPAATATLAPTQEELPVASPTFPSVQGPPATPDEDPTPTPVRGPTATPTAQATHVFSSDPTETPVPSNTPAPAEPGSITGRILWDGVPVVEEVMVRLEDQSYNAIGEARVDGDGLYRFDNLPPSGTGYNVLFAQEWNEAYEVDEAITWGWIGPVPVRGGATAAVPDLEISLLGFEPVSPRPGISFVASDISPEAPIVFEWKVYPGATRYWVDLLYGQDQERVWQSPLVEDPDTVVPFDGTLDDGEQIAPGAYWWGVGSQRAVGAYTLTVYGYLAPLRIEP